MNDVEGLRARLQADGWSLVEEEVRELIYYGTHLKIGWKVTASRGDRTFAVTRIFLWNALDALQYRIEVEEQSA